MSISSLLRGTFGVFSLGTTKNKATSAQQDPLDFPDAPPDVRRLIRDRRYLKILAPGDDIEFDNESIQFAWKAVEQEMAYVPAGHVTMINEHATAGEGYVHLTSAPVGASDVNAFFLDRCCVTNADYARFVDAGGYDDYQLWPEHILESMLQFVDSTGCAGPASWIDGKPGETIMDHPVVGICWYEANAYAQWAGKRLPTAAEWQRAGTWGKSPGDSCNESQYPWGNSFDPRQSESLGCGNLSHGAGQRIPRGKHSQRGLSVDW